LCVCVCQWKVLCDDFSASVSVSRILIISSFLLLQDRRGELVSAHGISQIGTSSASSTFGTGPRLSHTPTSDFQPPYFPPPYNLTPQQSVDFHHPHVNDPYSHLNSFHQGSQQHYHQLHPPERPLKYRDDPLNMHPGIGSYDARRDYGSIRRPDVLMHSGLDQDSLLLHGSSLPMENGTQVSTSNLCVGPFPHHPPTPMSSSVYPRMTDTTGMLCANVLDLDINFNVLSG
jgi:transcription factor AP-2 alpha/beta